MGMVFIGNAAPKVGDLGKHDLGINVNTGQLFTSGGPLPEMRIGGAQPAILDIAPSTGDNALVKLRNSQGGINVITGGGNLSIQQTTPSGSTEKTWIQCARNSGVALFFDTEKKMSTHSRGVEVTSQGPTEFVVHNTNSTDPALIDLRNNAASARMWVGGNAEACFGTADANGNNQQLAIRAARSGAVYLKYNGVDTFQTLPNGCHIDGRFLNIVNPENADNILLLRTSHANVNRGVRLIQESGSNQPWYIQSMNGAGGDIKTAVTGVHGLETILHFNGGTRIHTTAEGGKVGKGGTSPSHFLVYNDEGGVRLWTDGAISGLSHTTKDGTYLRNFITSNQSGVTELLHGDGYQALYTQSNGGILRGAWIGNVSTGSDRRLKKNEQKITGAIDKVLSLNGYIADVKQTLDSEDSMRMACVMADEVEKVQPELVFVGDGEDKLQSVFYNGLSPLLIEAFKDQHKLLKSMENKINELEGKLAA